MSKMPWRPPPEGEVTRLPTKVRVAGVPPGSAQEAAVIQQYKGQINRFYAKAVQQGDARFRGYQQLVGDLKLRYSVNYGQEIVDISVPLIEEQITKETKEDHIPWDWLLIEMDSSRYDYTYSDGDVGTAWAYGAAQTVFGPKDGDGEYSHAINPFSPASDSVRNSTNDPSVLSYAGPSPSNDSTRTFFGVVDTGPRVISSLLVDIRKFKTHLVLSVDLYARWSSLGTDTGPTQVVDVEIIGYYTPINDRLETYAITDNRVNTYFPEYATAASKVQIGPTKVAEDTGYFQAYTSSPPAPTPTEAELIRAAATDPPFLLGRAHNSSIYSTFSGTQGGSFATDGSGSWATAATSPGPNAADGTNPNDWYADIPTTTITAGPPAVWGEEWGPMSYTRKAKYWNYFGASGGAFSFPVPEGETSKIYVTGAEDRVVLIGPIFGNPSFPVEVPENPVDIRAQAFRGDPEFGYSERPAPAGGSQDYFTWDLPDRINSQDRLPLATIAESVPVPPGGAGAAVTPDGPLKDNQFTFIGRITFEQKSGGFSFTPAV